MDTFLAGDHPIHVETLDTWNKEFMFWQYVPVKMAGDDIVKVPPNIYWAKDMLSLAMGDFDLIRDSRELFIYMTVKSMFVNPFDKGNRPGWHIDGFGTEDTNYIWSDLNPTEFWVPKDSVNIYDDHEASMVQMTGLADAMPENVFPGINEGLYRLNSKCIHRVNETAESGFRNFVKISFSKDRYLAQGNSHNYEFEYDWSKEMVPRKETRNCPKG